MTLLTVAKVERPIGSTIDKLMEKWNTIGGNR